MTQRNGTTLTEVLVAIFIMAIGMMSLLTLFPVGALSMAQAIKDERAAQAAANAAAIAEAKGLRHDGIAPGGGVMLGTVEFWFHKMGVTDPADPRYIYSLAKYTTPPYDGPSYPIFVDPLGFNAGAGDLGDPQKPQLIGIPRSSASYVKGINQAESVKLFNRWFSLLDDITYVDPATNSQYGVPTVNPLSDPVLREGRYTWSYLVRRPRFRDSSVVDMSVMVYNARSQVVPFGEQVFADQQFPVVFDPSTNLVLVRYAAMNRPKPDIRKGQWIMDATLQQRQGALGTVPDPHGYLYRVVSVTDNGAVLTLELQTPPKASTVANPLSVMVFMDGVVEVFERGGGWQP